MYVGLSRAGAEGPEGPPGCGLKGQLVTDCGTIGLQTIMKITVDSCAVTKLTEKHPSLSLVSSSISSYVLPPFLMSEFSFGYLETFYLKVLKGEFKALRWNFLTGHCSSSLSGKSIFSIAVIVAEVFPHWPGQSLPGFGLNL